MLVSLKGLCDEEEKSLKVMKTSLKKLEDRQEYITAFIHKILSTEGQCILRHKMQVRVFFSARNKSLLSNCLVCPCCFIQYSVQHGLLVVVKQNWFFLGGLQCIKENALVNLCDCLYVDVEFVSVLSSLD